MIEVSFHAVAINHDTLPGKGAYPYQGMDEWIVSKNDWIGDRSMSPAGRP